MDKRKTGLPNHRPSGTDETIKLVFNDMSSNETDYSTPAPIFSVKRPRQAMLAYPGGPSSSDSYNSPLSGGRGKQEMANAPRCYSASAISQRFQAPVRLNKSVSFDIPGTPTISSSTRPCAQADRYSGNRHDVSNTGAPMMTKSSWGGNMHCGEMATQSQRTGSFATGQATTAAAGVSRGRTLGQTLPLSVTSQTAVSSPRNPLPSSSLQRVPRMLGMMSPQGSSSTQLGAAHNTRPSGIARCTTGGGSYAGAGGVSVASGGGYGSLRGGSRPVYHQSSYGADSTASKQSWLSMTDIAESSVIGERVIGQTFSPLHDPPDKPNKTSGSLDAKNKNHGDSHGGDVSLRVVTCNIGQLEGWSESVYSTDVILIYEVFGIVNSAVCEDDQGTTLQFILKDHDDSISATFYQTDRRLPRLARGQWYRCVGHIDSGCGSLSLRCLSVRQATESEKTAAKLLIESSDRQMNLFLAKYREI